MAAARSISDITFDLSHYLPCFLGFENVICEITETDILRFGFKGNGKQARYATKDDTGQVTWTNFTPEQTFLGSEISEIIQLKIKNFLKIDVCGQERHEIYAPHSGQPQFIYITPNTSAEQCLEKILPFMPADLIGMVDRARERKAAEEKKAAAAEAAPEKSNSSPLSGQSSSSHFAQKKTEKVLHSDGEKHRDRCKMM
jgi:hypothetical protein